MGNTNAREQAVQNGGGGGGHGRYGNGPTTSPPYDHRHSPTPRFSSSQQEPAVPLRLNGGSSFCPPKQCELRRYNIHHPPEEGIPTLITWSSGGSSVAVEGSWDNWRARKPLQRSGKDHTILLVLPSGVFRYRFIVDGETRHAPDLPCDTDEKGQAFNLLDVQSYVAENVENVSEFEVPGSPECSYGQGLPRDEDYAKEAMTVPVQLEAAGLVSSWEGKAPQHVVLNHVFVEKGESVVALGLTHRFQSKYVTVVLYKPAAKQLTR